jgi:hypothetical protein
MAFLIGSLSTKKWWQLAISKIDKFPPDLTVQFVVYYSHLGTFGLSCQLIFCFIFVSNTKLLCQGSTNHHTNTRKHILTNLFLNTLINSAPWAVTLRCPIFVYTNI